MSGLGTTLKLTIRTGVTGVLHAAAVQSSTKSQAWSIRMIDQPQALKIAREAFDQWQAGHPEQARILYEKAIPLADPQHWGLSAYYGEYACVLNELGKYDQATVQLEKSLATELA